MNKFILALIVVLSTSVFAGKDRGGGDPKEQLFMKNFSRAMERLKLIAFAEDNEKSDLSIFLAYHWIFVESEVSRIQIEFTKENLTIDGVEKAAINYPPKYLIKVNEHAWNKLSANEKEALALHEVLGILAETEPSEFKKYFDDSAYKYSSLIRNDNSNNKAFYATANYKLSVAIDSNEENLDPKRCYSGTRYAQDKAVSLCKMAGYLVCELKNWGVKDYFADKNRNLNCTAWAEAEGKTANGMAPVSSEVGKYGDLIRQLSDSKIQIQFNKSLSPGSVDQFTYEYTVSVNKSGNNHKTAPKRFCIREKKWEDKCGAMTKSLSGQFFENILIHAKCVAPTKKDSCRKTDRAQDLEVLEMQLESIN